MNNFSGTTRVVVTVSQESFRSLTSSQNTGILAHFKKSEPVAHVTAGRWGLFTHTWKRRSLLQRWKQIPAQRHLSAIAAPPTPCPHGRFASSLHPPPFFSVPFYNLWLLSNQTEKLSSEGELCSPCCVCVCFFVCVFCQKRGLGTVFSSAGDFFLLRIGCLLLSSLDAFPLVSSGYNLRLL